MALSAMDFSTDIGGGFAFGINTENPVATLRRIADMIESKQILLLSARVTGLASGEDYTKTGVRLVLAEKFTKRPDEV